MADSKPLASLSPSLLARKGSARPAMRPQAYINLAAHKDDHVEDLGWNDMGHDLTLHEVIALPGHELPENVVEMEAPRVVQQQHGLSQNFEQPNVAQFEQHVVRAAPGSHGKAAFTLRLDPERHLKLRLFSALTHRSAQQIVTAALDAVLEAQTEMIASATLQSPKRIMS